MKNTPNQSQITTTCSHVNLHKRDICNAEFVEYATTVQNSRNSALISCIQEPHANRMGKIDLIPDRRLIYKRNLQKVWPRAAIYVSENLDVSPINEYIDRDMTTVAWRTGNKEVPLIIVTSIYSPQEIDVIHPKLHRLIKLTKRRKAQLLLQMDSNSHSQLWGNLHEDTKGKYLTNLLIQHGLHLHNRGKLPDVYTYRQDDRKSIIDLTISTYELAQYVKRWEITQHIITSDHLLIEFQLQVKPSFLPPKRNLRKGNWAKFTTMTEDFEPNDTVTWSQQAFNDEAKAFENDIMNVLNKTHPLRPRRATLPNFAWLDDELAAAKRQVKRALDRYRTTRAAAEREKVKAAYKAKRDVLRKGRYTGWRSYITDRTDFKKVAEFVHAINRESMNPIGNMTTDTGKVILDPYQSFNILIQEHFPGCEDVQRQRQKQLPAITLNDDEPDDSPITYITEDKVIKAIESFGPYKAAGPDGIQPCVLQNLGPKMIQRLTRLYKISLKMNCTPNTWGQTKVIFLAKPGKADYSQPRAYRPISLMPFPMKGMERILLWYIQDTALTKSPLNMNQHAFRKGRSTDSALSSHVEYIEQTFIKRQFGLGIYLDVKGAYDALNTESIIKAMRKKQIHNHIIRWYAHYLNNRYITATHNGVTVMKKATRGTPQGGVLSPIIFDITFDGGLDLFNEKGRIKLTGFADDISLFIRGPNLRVLQEQMQKAITKLVVWCGKNGLQFSPEKSCAIVFTRKRYERAQLVPLTIEGAPIEYKNEVKYLGITLDHKLTWKAHIAKTIIKAKRTLMRVRNVTGMYWGLRPSMASWLYRGMIRPVITYGCQLWVRCTEAATVRQKLKSLQRMALMSLGFFRHSTPTAGLEVITNTSPLDLHCRKEAAAAYIRTTHTRRLTDNEMKTNLHSTAVGHRQYIQAYLNEYEFENEATDSLHEEVFQWDKKYKINLESFKDGQPHEDNTIKIFSDGSKDQSGNTGSGYVIYRPNQPTQERHFHLGKYTTVFQAEVYAIQKAAEYVDSLNLRGKTLNFYSDSQAAIQALNNSRVTSNVVHLTMYQLNNIGENNTILVNWIKAHVGHTGNEKADELAKAGAADTENHVTDIPNVSTAIIRQRLTDCIRKQWTIDWQTNQPCRQTKHFFPFLVPKFSRDLMKYGRTYFSALVQLITGHNFMNRHNAIVALGTPDIELAHCQYCDDEEAEESTAHILAECEAFGIERHHIFGTNVIDMNNLSRIKASKFIEFLKTCKLESFLDIMNYESEDISQ